MGTRAPHDYVAYCGLSCKLCSLIATLPRQAGQLLETMKDDGWERFGDQIYEGFSKFWEVLNSLAVTDQSSPLCIGGCGNPECEIRKCAVERGLQVCAFCPDFPCELILSFTRRYPFLMKNNERIRESGIDAWLAEQDELLAQGITNSSLARQKPPEA